MNTYRIAVASAAKSLLQRARQLAERLTLPLIDLEKHDQNNSYDYLLLFTADFLGLIDTKQKKQKPFYIDLLSDKLAYRSKLASKRNELLIKAAGAKPSEQPFIVDATAGLLCDSFILASYGFTVTALEQSPIIHALLEDGLKRAATSPNGAIIANRIHLYCDEASTWLKENHSRNGHAPDIIYLDPMFPARKKSASVKKEMVILHNLLGSAKNENMLLETALACAARRVVVKRPRLAAALSARVPNFSLSGNSCRFDVYLTMLAEPKRV